MGLDGSPAQPVAVKPDGIATFTLKLGKNALSSKVNNRRFSLLVQLDLPVEQADHPEITRDQPRGGGALHRML